MTARNCTARKSYSQHWKNEWPTIRAWLLRQQSLQVSSKPTPCRCRNLASGSYRVKLNTLTMPIVKNINVITAHQHCNVCETLTVMIGANFKSLVSSHQYTTSAYRLVMKDLNFTCSPLFPLGGFSC